MGNSNVTCSNDQDREIDRTNLNKMRFSIFDKIQDKEKYKTFYQYHSDF